MVDDGPAQGPGADLEDQPRFLEQGDELHGGHEAQLRALPADQGFHAVDAPRGRVDLGLVMQHEFLLFQRLPQLVLERELFADPFGHLLRMEQIPFPGRLCLLQGRFGILEQGVRVGAIVGEQGNAGLGGDPELGAAHHVRRSEAFREPLLDESRDFALGAHARAHDREAVGADPRHPDRTRVALDALGDLFEQLVARLPAEGVVDDLEPVDVHHGNGEPALLALGRAHVLDEALVEQAAVGEAGERVVIGEVIELLRLRDVVERKRDVTGEFDEELHFLLIEETDLRRIQGQHADSLPRHQQRQHDQRMKAAHRGFLAQQDPRILRHVLDDHRSSLSDRASRQSVPFGVGLVQREGHQLEVIVLAAVPGDRLHKRRLAIDHAHPGEFEFPRLHRDAARVAEKLVPVAHADDEAVDTAQHRVDAREAEDFFLSESVLGHVLQRAEPSRSSFGVGLTLERLDHLAYLAPFAVGAPQPVLDVLARTRAGGLDGRCAKPFTIVRMQEVHPLARAPGHLSRFHPDQLRQGVGPALERPIGPCDDVRDLRHELGAVQPRLALVQSLFGEPASPPHLGFAQLALERRQEPREIVLHDIVVRAGLHHVDGDVLADRARNENERDVAPRLARDRERLAPVELRHGEIRDDEMRPELVQLAPEVRFGLHPAALEVEPSAFQLALDQLGVGFAVLREQYPERFSHVALVRPGVHR